MDHYGNTDNHSLLGVRQILLFLSPDDFPRQFSGHKYCNSIVPRDIVNNF